jgi:hypothetical protein
MTVGEMLMGGVSMLTRYIKQVNILYLMNKCNIMIQKELIKTRKDGVDVYRIYSDDERKIQNTSTNEIYNGGVVTIYADDEYIELEELIDIPGAPNDYQGVLNIIKEKKRLEHLKERMQRTTTKTSMKINRINLTDNESLSVKELYPSWDSKIGKNVEVGYKLLYNDNLWRVRQNHMVQEIYPPSLSTAALYEVINYQHEGTIDDPIPYNPPMEIFNSKYYIQNDIKYLCNRDSGTALSHDLSALVGLYVEIVENK